MTPKSAPPRPLLMAHYLPWYEARPPRERWGWHWTMNRYDPDRLKGGRREAASHYRPLIGLYDSGDPDVLECHALLLKFAGFDGVIIDWYGDDDLFDYAAIHRNTERLVPILRRAGLRFALCYEDQTVGKLIEAKRFATTDAVPHVQRLMGRVQKGFFASPAYLRLDGRPVLLSFGVSRFDDAEWGRILAGLSPRPLYFPEHERRATTAAAGAFDWPIPSGGTAGALAAQEKFHERAKAWPGAIATAFPRFHDIYAEAKVHASWGRIEDRGGRTFEETLTRALQSGARVVQAATWNDWGEGTQIEPSVEFGYRDLEATQRLRRRHVEPAFPYAARDLRLPVEWYRARKRHAGDRAVRARLDALFPLLAAGKTAEARAILSKVKG